MNADEAAFWKRATPQTYSSLSHEDLAGLLWFWRYFPNNYKVARSRGPLHASDVKALTGRAFQILKMACEDRGIDTGELVVTGDGTQQDCPQFARLLTKLQVETTRQTGSQPADGEVEWSKTVKLQRWAEWFGVSDDTVRGWFKSGQVTASKLGGSWRVAIADLPTNHPEYRGNRK